LLLSDNTPLFHYESCGRNIGFAVKSTEPASAIYRL